MTHISRSMLVLMTSLCCQSCLSPNRQYIQVQTDNRENSFVDPFSKIRNNFVISCPTNSQATDDECIYLIALSALLNTQKDTGLLLDKGDKLAQHLKTFLTTVQVNERSERHTELLACYALLHSRALVNFASRFEHDVPQDSIYGIVKSRCGVDSSDTVLATMCLGLLYSLDGNRYRAEFEKQSQFVKRLGRRDTSYMVLVNWLNFVFHGFPVTASYRQWVSSVRMEDLLADSGKWEIALMNRDIIACSKEDPKSELESIWLQSFCRRVHGEFIVHDVLRGFGMTADSEKDKLLSSCYVILNTYSGFFFRL